MIGYTVKHTQWEEMQWISHRCSILCWWQRMDLLQRLRRKPWYRSLRSVNPFSRLERELDLQLFDRQGIHLVLNPAGEEFLQQVRPILTAVRRLPEFVKSRHMPRRKYRINVGAAEAVMGSFLHGFFRKEPQAEVILTDESWIDDCDLSISSGPSGREEDSVWLLEEEILLAVPVSMGPQQELDVLSLEGLPLILPREGAPSSEH